jgi:ACR3 family arsenite transporter
LIFFLAYGWAKAWKLKHDIAAPAGMIGASNFFELAVAVAISLFGLESGAALATVVGVLVEVPVMLSLVKIANNTRHWFGDTENISGLNQEALKQAAITLKTSGKGGKRK